LILFFKFFLYLNIDKLRVINADGTGLGLLSDHLIYHIHGLLRELDQSESLFLFHIWVNHIDKVLEVRAISVWR